MKQERIKKLFKVKWVGFLLLGLWFVVLAWNLNNKVASIKFVDEEDNMALGMYLLRGEKLYNDLFSHHQPLGYVFSAWIQKISLPNSIYLLIKYHRFFVWGWALGWTLIWFGLFGWSAVWFSLIYESIKSLMLGQLFLAESLVVYPLIGLLMLTNRSKKFNQADWLVGFLAGLVMLLLAPMWPVVLFLVGVFWWKNGRNWQSLVKILLGGLVWVLVSLVYMDIGKYWHNMWVINFGHYIPQDGGRLSVINILQAVMSPMLALLSGNKSGVLWVIKLLSGLYLILVLAVVKHKKWFRLAWLVGVLSLANIRFVMPGSEIYAGFHLLPWLGILIAVVGIWLFEDNKGRMCGVIKVIKFGCGMMVVMVSLKVLGKDLVVKGDAVNDTYINYSEEYSIGRAVRILASSENEKLMTIPDGWLVYWESGIDHGSVMLNYYTWMREVDELKKYVTNSLEKRPEYVYYHGDMEEVASRLKVYTELEKEGRKTGLFVKSVKLDSLDEDQISELGFLGFELDK